MDEPRASLLIVEDDLDIADMLNAYFRVQGYEVSVVHWGEDGVEMCQNQAPDLVILDIRLPDIDGFEVARRLRTNRRTRDIPIIFLTEKRERLDRLKGLELHAEDYITKPFDIQELRLRVRNTLQRARRGSLTNPVTGLPEGGLVDEHLGKFLAEKDWKLLLISLGHLDAFRELYGFVASDDLLRAVALMIQDSLQQAGGEGFVGHWTSTDFVLLTRQGATAEMQDRLKRRLVQSFDYFYRHQDREVDRLEGRRLTVTVTAISKESGALTSLEELKTELEKHTGR